MSRRKEPTIPAELLDQLLAGTDAASALDQGGSPLSRAISIYARSMSTREITGHARELYATRVKIRDEGLVRSKAIHMDLGVRADGRK